MATHRPTPLRHALHHLSQPLLGGLYVLCLAGLIATACQPQSLDPAPSPTAPPPAESSPSPTPVPIDAANYVNDRFGFQFAYPVRFTLTENDQGWSSDGSLSQRIDLWSPGDYQRIQDGVFDGGSEYPPNVNIDVYTNTAGLSPQDWMQTGDRFVGVSPVVDRQIGGQAAIAFRSTGLYESQNLVVATPDGQHILVIALHQLNPNEASDYDSVYQQVIDTFQFTAQ